MKVVIAPDSFKESLSALEVCMHIKAGFKTHFPDAHYHLLPLADGGEGTVEVLLQALNGQKIVSQVEGPLGEPVLAEWALLEEGKTALIEIAAASGLDKLPPHRRNPLLASTFGTGQLIKEALDRGVNKLLLGLGGSATNDAGAGIIEALGGVFYNLKGEKISRGGQALVEVAHIDLSQLDERCAQLQCLIACDVTNPLTGLNGASHIFGPQKGATLDDAARLDAALAHFADLAHRLTGENHSNSPGYGAAGGTPLGLSLIFKTQIKPGIEMVLEVLEADKVLQGADLVITGEGQMDNQTLQGKTPFGIARKAVSLGIPVIGIAGSLGAESEALMHCFKGIFSAVRAPQSLEQVLAEAGMNLQRTASNVAAMLKLGGTIKP
ncbi:glycerate kinase [Klebsiella grimontii]|uniref:glycerate kinase n=1 Tax=Klebsiella grimontii TaxID=2058152 RepID=UPI001171146E|nr:glycerate kinase [Klebsiella grimontii]VUS47175.1 Glycerate 3-kinase [Klebsiella grimontii]